MGPSQALGRFFFRHDDMEFIPVSFQSADSRIDAQADRLLYDDMRSRLLLVSIVAADSVVRAILSALQDRRSLDAKIEGDWRALIPDAGGGVARRVRLLSASRSNQGGHESRSRTLTHGAWIAHALLDKEESKEVILLNPLPERMGEILVARLAAPVLPEWGEWLYPQLSARGYLRALSGFGIAGVVLQIREDELHEILGEGVRSGDLAL